MKKSCLFNLTAAVVILAILSLLIYPVLIGPWHRGWGATPEEQAMPLPGDELIANPELIVTRAITIEAPAKQVWAWVVQSGADHGGLYSYTLLESLVACPIVNADRVHPEWQNPQPGDPWAMCPDGKGPPAYTVARVEPGQALVIGHPEPVTTSGWFDTWSFTVQPVDADTSRLIHRSRTETDPGWVKAIELPMFVMERGMMRGIQARAEGRTVDPSEEDPFRVIFGVLVIAYLLFRVYYGRDAGGRAQIAAPGARLQIVLMLLATLATVPAVFYPWGGTLFGGALDAFHISLPTGVRLLGALIFLVGDGLFFAAHRALRGNWSAGVVVHPGHELVTCGPYHWMRHPMYTAFFLIGSGMFLLSANLLVGLPFLVVMVALYLSRVEAEEALLLAHFGEEYRLYLQRTRRLWPGKP